MPKLRNSSTDVGKLVQWFGRKARNHHPLEELGLAAGNPRPNQYKSKHKGDVFVVANREDTLVYRAGSRVFVATFEEVDPTMLDGYQLEAVGY